MTHLWELECITRAFSQVLKHVCLFSLLADELTRILKKLSLEKYQPIFEEQEVRTSFLTYVDAKFCHLTDEVVRNGGFCSICEHGPVMTVSRGEGMCAGHILFSLLQWISGTLWLVL